MNEAGKRQIEGKEKEERSRRSVSIRPGLFVMSLWNECTAAPVTAVGGPSAKNPSPVSSLFGSSHTQLYTALRLLVSQAD